MTEDGWQSGPLLLAEPWRHLCAVEVLKRSAARLGADKLQAVELEQDAHVVADIAQRLFERLGERARARRAVFDQVLQDLNAEAI